jgi:hypothetical protein
VVTGGGRKFRAVGGVYGTTSGADVLAACLFILDGTPHPLTRRPLSGPLFFIHHEHDMLLMYRMDHGSVEELQFVTCENCLALEAISGANDE